MATEAEKKAAEEKAAAEKKAAEEKAAAEKKAGVRKDKDLKLAKGEVVIENQAGRQCVVKADKVPAGCKVIKEAK